MEIKPAYVIFEQYESYCDLKLLQFLYNKGFRFKLETEGHRVANSLAEQRFNEGDVSYCYNYITYSVVIEWLRVKHGIWVYSYCGGNNKFHYGISNSETGVIIHNSYKRDGNKLQSLFKGFNSPKEAYSAAFDYIRENNLI